MTLWKGLTSQSKTLINNFGDGINVGVPPFEVGENELTYVRNMGFDEYPALVTRSGRQFYSTKITTLSSGYSIGQRANEQLHVINGNTWQYWNTATTSLVDLTTVLTGSKTNIQDFNTGSIRYTIMMNGTQKKYWDGSSTALDLGDGTTPLTDIFTVHEGRIFACKGATMYYTGINLINDWTTPNSAGSITLTRAKGDITGIVNYNDKIIVFTENSMHELYGDSPSNFRLVDVEGEVGCLVHYSIVKANKKLYWHWLDGIYEYNGGTPVKISGKVDKYFDKVSYSYKNWVTAGSINDTIYFSVPYVTIPNNLLIVYDTREDKWSIETGNFNDFVTIGNSVYGLDSTGGILNMKTTEISDNGTAISFDAITKPYLMGTGENRETVSGMSILYKGSTDATFNILYSTHPTDENSTSFNNVFTTSDFQMDNIHHTKRLILPPTDMQDESYHRIRFTGTGRVIINRLEKTFRIKRR